MDTAHYHIARDGDWARDNRGEPYRYERKADADRNMRVIRLLEPGEYYVGECPLARGCWEVQR